jgi:tetratricopeptide (TPR) repeat protein
MLSFALNFAVHGTATWGYHAINLAIHLAAALVLFGIVARTLSRGRLAHRYRHNSKQLALAVAILWCAHPLQTQSVTYIVQRYESLMGFFYLLTLYCFIRAVDSPRPVAWYARAVASCALGIGAKEVMVTAPLMVLWYDRALVASSWREILRKRYAFYGVLAGMWGLLALLMLSRKAAYISGGTAMFVPGLTQLDYALSQPGIILHYLRLCFWPSGQCLDYGWPVAHTTVEIWPPLVVIGILSVATLWCIRRAPALGFLGGWFFVVLAPTSSIVPLKDLAFEHRMYLPLAAVVTAVVIAGYEILQKGLARLRVPRSWCPGVQMTLFVAVALSLGLLTLHRNRVYASELCAWEDVVRKAPHHHRAHTNMGNVLREQGRFTAALIHYEKALKLSGESAVLYNNMALVFEKQDQVDRALELYDRALEVDPKAAKAHANLGVLLFHQGRTEEGIEHCRRAVRISPNSVHAHFKLALVLSADRPNEAIRHYKFCVQFQPNHAQAHNNLGVLYERQGMLSQATWHYRKAVRFGSDSAESHFNLARMLSTGRPERAVEHYEQALRFQPDYAKAHDGLGAVLMREGRLQEAESHFRHALRIDPKSATAHVHLAIALAQQQRHDEARRQLARALQLKPEYGPAMRDHPILKPIMAAHWLQRNQ